MTAFAFTAFAVAVVCAPIAIISRNSDRTGALYTALLGDLAALAGIVALVI